jgi:hypothetical protein
MMLNLGLLIGLIVGYKIGFHNMERHCLKVVEGDRAWRSQRP